MMTLSLLLAAGTLSCGGVARDYVAQFNAADEELYTNAIPNAAAAEFLERNVPTFACPDADIERTYYFRWWTFRKHLRKTSDGWVVSEFLPDVTWAGNHNTISCPAAHHVMEGRWLRDSSFIRDYAQFWYRGGTLSGPRAYASWMAKAVCDFCKVTGERAFAESLLDDFAANWRAWEHGWTMSCHWSGNRPFEARLDPAYGLVSILDDREGSELSLGGHGFRPLVNSAMYADAWAIAALARRAGRGTLADEFAAKASAMEAAVKGRLWNSAREFFTVLSTNGEHRSVCELQGYMPWYAGMPLAGYEAAWRHLTSTNGFAAPKGLTCAERGDPGFVLDRCGHACKWNGPSWPYATSIALTALANAIRADESGVVGRADFVFLLRQYAAAHMRTREDGTTVPWIDENLDPFTGEWLARALLIEQGRTKHRERGKDYNHSTFCDLVISGLVGIVPQEEPNMLVVDPLFPSDWDYLRLERVRYHGHDVSVLWDRTGAHGGDKGFAVRVDGCLLARTEVPKRIACDLTGAAGEVCATGLLWTGVVRAFGDSPRAR